MNQRISKLVKKAMECRHYQEGICEETGNNCVVGTKFHPEDKKIVLDPIDCPTYMAVEEAEFVYTEVFG